MSTPEDDFKEQGFHSKSEMRRMAIQKPQSIEQKIEAEFEKHIIPGIDGYFASRDGSIWCDRRGGLKKRKLQVNKDGYLVFNYFDKDLRKNKVVSAHRCVIAAFKGIDSRLVNHLDHDRKNNRIENLEYSTPQENSDHMKMAYRNPAHNRGMDDCRVLSILTFKNILPATRIAQALGVSAYSAQRAVKGVYYKEIYDSVM